MLLSNAVEHAPRTLSRRSAISSEQKLPWMTTASIAGSNHVFPRGGQPGHGKQAGPQVGSSPLKVNVVVGEDAVVPVLSAVVIDNAADEGNRNCEHEHALQEQSHC